MALNAMEQVAVLSSEIIDDIQEGEPYESLVRRLVCLDNNLRDIARQAASAKTTAVDMNEEEIG